MSGFVKDINQMYDEFIGSKNFQEGGAEFEEVEEYYAFILSNVGNISFTFKIGGFEATLERSLYSIKKSDIKKIKEENINFKILKSFLLDNNVASEDMLKKGELELHEKDYLFIIQNTLKSGATFMYLFVKYDQINQHIPFLKEIYYAKPRHYFNSSDNFLIALVEEASNKKELQKSKVRESGGEEYTLIKYHFYRPLPNIYLSEQNDFLKYIIKNIPNTKTILNEFLEENKVIGKYASPDEKPYKMEFIGKNDDLFILKYRNINNRLNHPYYYIFIKSEKFKEYVINKKFDNKDKFLSNFKISEEKSGKEKSIQFVDTSTSSVSPALKSASESAPSALASINVKKIQNSKEKSIEQRLSDIEQRLNSIEAKI